MKIYYPYPANDGKHKYYIITILARLFISALRDIMTLHLRKMKSRKIGIFSAIRREKTGLSQVLTLLVFGLAGYFGISQLLTQVTMISRNNSDYLKKREVKGYEEYMVCIKK